MRPLECRIFRSTYLPGASGRLLEAVAEGIRAAGDRCEFSDKIGEDCDVAVHPSGPKALDVPLVEARREVIRRYPRRLVVESAVFRRGAERTLDDPYYRVAWNGFLRDEANYGAEGSPPDRWERIRREQGIEVWPWRRGGRYILVCTQKASDASLRGTCMDEWLVRVLLRIRVVTGLPVRVRKHPLERRPPKLPDIEAVELSTTKELAEDLAGARACVTFTSLSAIEAVCDGVPTVTTDPGNLAWPVAWHRPEALVLVDEPGWLYRHPDREQWLFDLAYSQWRLSEIREGIPWRRLRAIYWPS